MQTQAIIKKLERVTETLKRSPKREYTIEEIQEGEFIPWARDPRTIRKIIMLDSKGEGILDAAITGKGTQRRYLVKGSNIIKYLRKYGPVLMHTARKPKQNNYEPKKRSKDTQ